MSKNKLGLGRYPWSLHKSNAHHRWRLHPVAFPLEVSVFQTDLMSWKILLLPLGLGAGGCGETAMVCPDSEHCLFHFPVWVLVLVKEVMVNI